MFGFLLRYFSDVDARKDCYFRRKTLKTLGKCVEREAGNHQMNSSPSWCYKPKVVYESQRYLDGYREPEDTATV